MREVITLKKLLFILILVIVMTILFIGCVANKFSQVPPELTITIGDKQLDYIVAKNKWNGAIYDREDTFKTILKDSSDNEIPYIKISSIAKINFFNNPPSELIISDILIDENGNQLYSDKEIISIPIELKNGIGLFEIKNHWASGLSSYFVEGKTNIRGFRLIATWGQNECEYAFIIRTD